ncbi:hypothetical protein CQA44_10890 [Helicobacter sp. MIT 14-3879]|nr:hypothetical protein CQA44_10890 [Helicobacter sp. MIT 14-3879]
MALALLANTASALEITPFGKVGVIGSFNFGNGNTLDDPVLGYLGVTAHLGVDFNISGFRLGVGAMAGFAPLTLGAGGGYGSNFFVNHFGSLYKSPYVDASELYFGYSDHGISLIAGRYNASKLLPTAEWIGGHNQGLAFSFQSDYFGIWATWVNDYLRNGYNANADLGLDGRYGMDLAGFSGYSSSWDNFNIRNNLFAGGVDVKFAEYFSFSPYAQYWVRSHLDNYLQVGARLSVAFNAGPVKSKTTLRGLWTNNLNSGGNGVMWQADEELLFVDMIKLGGGYFSVGGIGLNELTIVDRTRFYGQYLFPQGYNGTGLINRGYLDAKVQTWYVFTGFKLGEMLDFDVLYADGDYKEFSAILNYNILSSENFAWSVGGGYVTNGFGNAHTGLAYTKLKF